MVILFSQLCLMTEVYFVTLNVYLTTKFVCHPKFYLSLIITIIHHELYQWLSNLSLLLIFLVIVFYIMAIIDVATEIAQCSRKYFGKILLKTSATISSIIMQTAQSFHYNKRNKVF